MTEPPYYLPAGEFGIAALTGQTVGGVFKLYALAVPQPSGPQPATGFTLYAFNTASAAWSTVATSGSARKCWRGVTVAPFGSLAVPSFSPTPAGTPPLTEVYTVGFDSVVKS